MKQNAEFIRNLWLQISPARLIGAVAVIALVVTVVFFATDTTPWEVMVSVASAALTFVLIFWGATAARATVKDEIRGNTWNQQRMSGLTPWQITWGKLFGGTAYVWWISLIVLALWSAARIMTHDALDLHASVLTWMAGAVAVHAVAMIAAVGFRSADGSRIEEIPVGVLIVAILILTQSAVPFLLYQERGSTWHNTYLSHAQAMLLLTAPFALWAVVGAHRSIQREMQETLLPWALPLALLTFGFLFAGFIPTYGIGASVLLGVIVSFSLTAALAWAAFFTEPQSIGTTRECLTLLRAGRIRDALSRMTTASVLLIMLCALGVICAIGLAASASSSEPFAMTSAGERFGNELLNLAPVIFIWVIIVAIRDFCVTHALQAMSRTGTRAMGAFAVYLAVMYFAVPLLLRSTATAAKDFWLPTSTSAPATCLVGALASLALVVLLCRRRWRAASKQTTTAL